MRKLVSSVFVFVLLVSALVVSPVVAQTGCPVWCKPCTHFCKEVFCYAVKGSVQSENGVKTFTVHEAIDDQGAVVQALRGLTFQVSEHSVEVEPAIEVAYKAHFTYDSKVSQIILHGSAGSSSSG